MFYLWIVFYIFVCWILGTKEAVKVIFFTWWMCTNKSLENISLHSCSVIFLSLFLLQLKLYSCKLIWNNVRIVFCWYLLFLFVVCVKLCAWVRLKSIVVTYVYPRMKFGLFPVLLTTCQTSSIFLAVPWREDISKYKGLQQVFSYRWWGNLIN